MSDFCIAILVIVIAGMVALDAMFLRWLRSRSHKFDLTPNKFQNSDTPPCWPYGWPGE